MYCSGKIVVLPGADRMKSPPVSGMWSHTSRSVIFLFLYIYINYVRCRGVDTFSYTKKITHLSSMAGSRSG